MAILLYDISEKYLGKEASQHVAWITTSICDVATKMDDRITAIGMSRLSLVLLAFAIGYILAVLRWFLSDNIETPSRRFRSWIFRIVRSFPPVKRMIEKELEKEKVKFLEKRSAPIGGTVEDKKLMALLPRLPADGMSSEEVMARLDAYHRILAHGGEAYKSAKVSGAVYHMRRELEDLAVDVFRHQLHANPLHFDIFGDARRCEAELVSWIWRVFNGPEDHQPCGVCTTGGTESITLAVLACRNRALARGIRWPEIVCCTTAHCAVDKSAEMFRVRVVKVEPQWPEGEADVVGFQRAITSNTCMLFASAPSYPWGVIDPISKIAELGVKYDIPVHCDCCLGGFIVPFLESAGFPLKNGPIDFRNKGVTTISVDTHKYGFAPKGSSLLLYRDSSLRSHQVFVATNWPGGVYATPSIPGSRSGAVIVCAWAVVLRNGFNVYVESTRQIVRVTNDLRQRIPKIPGLQLLGHSEGSVVAFEMIDKSMSNCIYLVYDRLVAKGWNLNALQNPPALHFALTDVHCKPEVADNFIKDLEEATKETLEAIASGKENTKMGTAALYGTTQAIPDRTVIVDFVKQLIEDVLAV